MRIGLGYDVHRLVEDRKLILGGVEIPYEKGLLGHSDADVLTHAIIDALYGAAALGDIGSHFPDSDCKYRGADSIELLKICNKDLKDKGYKVINLDSIIVAQAPKVLPYVNEMRKIISSALDISIDQVSIKGKTEEKLGFTGEGLGIAAHASVLIDEI
jgi:2-C-methyl-D-erythritol 2,4-cyclodiphosphate synthase